LRLAKYVAGYAWTHPDRRRDLRRHVCLRLNLDLDLNLNPVPYPALNRASFQKPFEKPNPALFRSLFRFKYPSLYNLAYPAPYRVI